LGYIQQFRAQFTMDEDNTKILRDRLLAQFGPASQTPCIQGEIAGAYGYCFTHRFEMNYINTQIALDRMRGLFGEILSKHAICTAFCHWFRSHFEMNAINQGILADKCREFGF
jgi:hypothetical protein